MEKKIHIALAGNANSGKTTLFNALTGSNQYVGNWPGVTVEKKEGKVKNYDDVVITDLPGIYSLSPYTLEEVVARDYLVNEQVDVILNIVDGTNLERNLYLTTQLAELGIPLVVAINMMDVVKKNGDLLKVESLSERLGCPVIGISALKEEGVWEAVKTAVSQAKSTSPAPAQRFSEEIEEVLSMIQTDALDQVNERQKRWYAVKVFERDDKVLQELQIPEETFSLIDAKISGLEKQFDDDAESIISCERYSYIASSVQDGYSRKNMGHSSVSDKIDQIVTHRWLGLPIFALVMFLVYYIAMVSVGAKATDWANDGLFGEGWHLLGRGSAEYDEALEEYSTASYIIEGYEAYVEEHGAEPVSGFRYAIEDEETLAVDYKDADLADYNASLLVVEKYGEEPDPADYGTWVEGIPVLVERALTSAKVAPWLSGLVQDGIVSGVGAVLGFVPQMLVLFFMLALLEASGYMARVAFVLDRVFRKFGLSGKSFIPMLVGLGCSVPGIMASRTIENERDRKMTIITTPFIPCSAKVPFIAMVTGAIFGGNPWIATSSYFVGLAAIVLSGVMLKKTRMFAGTPAPFVLELPAYRRPTIKNALKSTWERGWSFIRKAGTIIFLSSIIIWFMTYFGVVEGSFRMLDESELDASVLAFVGGAVAWIFKPLGWGSWQATVASITGLVAKENIVGSMGIVYGGSGELYHTLAHEFSVISGYSFLVFNLLCAPCFAAIGATKREMNSSKWTWFAIGYQCVFAYVVSLIIYQFGSIFTGTTDVPGLVAATASLAGMIYLLVRPYQESKSLSIPVKARD